MQKLYLRKNVQKQIDEVKQYIEEMRKDNPKVAEIMTNLVSEIEADENKYKGQSILNIVESMKRDCIEKVISDFCCDLVCIERRCYVCGSSLQKRGNTKRKRDQGYN